MPASDSSARGGLKGREFDLLIKGVVCLLIGVAVLLAPRFMGGGELRAVIAQSAMVGWFAVVLGAAFVGHYALRRWRT